MKSAKKTYQELLTSGKFTPVSVRVTQYRVVVQEPEEYIFRLDVPPHPAVEAVSLRVGKTRGGTEYNILCVRYRRSGPSSYSLPVVLSFDEAARLAERLPAARP